MTADEARKALEVVIRSHSANMLHLERILAAWRDMTPTERTETDNALAVALVKADAETLR